MANIHVVDRSSPEPLGSIARASDIARDEVMKGRGYPPGVDYREFPVPLRGEIHKEVCARARHLLAQE